MQDSAYLKCINPKCGLEYPISSTNVQCEKGHVLDVKYKNKSSPNLKETFYQRRNSKGSIFNESGVWRFRELLNFCQIDTEDNDECAKFLVSLDGAEGRQSKPYQMSKAAEFTGLIKKDYGYSLKGTILVVLSKITVWYSCYTCQTSWS